MLFEKIREAEEKRDTKIYMDILHDDYVAVSHSSGKEMTKEEMRPFVA